MEKNKLVSIVIPCLNEEKNINRTFDELLSIFGNHPYDFEIIAVDDGSKDGTWKIIKEYSERYPEIKGVNLMANFGQSAAYMAGFDVSEGDYVITVSADLEVPLSNINRVIELLEQGYDFVNTHRVGRWGNEKAERAAKSNMANKLISKISGVSMQDRGSGMKGFRRVLIDNLSLYGEMHRFIPDYLTVYGAKMTEFDVDFKDRDYGVSAYSGSKRTIKVILDLMTLFFMLYFARKPFKALPGRIFGFTGAVMSGAGFLSGLYLVLVKLGGQSIGNRPLLTLSVLLIIVGVQLMMMGMLGELMLRVYFESSGRKTYTIRDIVR
ncbi:glycosyltransferase [candidate division WWE3 bacterium]|jgi:dolichol-phosphate mannosyltransferase|uniref:Glycosyltransferase n=1 Tax=candidate division WWE3 bacterium TaxID=2053526 RepID=A0A3A4ZJE3_UNCKA|nr:MAG: glycosyltransferase [candidate division WWE3 bacterium]